MRSKRTLSVTGVIAGLTLFIAACGGASSDEPAATEPSPDTAAPVEETVDETVEETGVTTQASEPSEPSEPSASEPPAEAAGDVPRAIISLSPTATEMLYAIGAGDQVLAVDDFSNFPPAAAEKMQGLSGFTPNVEAIVGLEPDLVVTDGTNPDLLQQLDQLGVPRWEGPAVTSFDEVYAQIEQLGVATGHVAEAADLVTRMRADVEAVRAGLPELAEPLTYYHELDSTFFSVTSDTFIGAVYDQIGLVNIADAVGDGNPYPQLSAEFIVAEDPDLIFLACTKYCGETAESVAARDGWGDLTAVVTGGVIELDDDVASRWGPRIVDLLRQAGDAVAAVAELQTAG